MKRKLRVVHQPVSLKERRTEYYALPSDPAVGFHVGPHKSIGEVQDALTSHDGMVGEWTIVTKVSKVVVERDPTFHVIDEPRVNRRGFN